MGNAVLAGNVVLAGVMLLVWLTFVAFAVYTFVLQVRANKAILRIEKMLGQKFEYMNVWLARIACYGGNTYRGYRGSTEEE